MLLKIVLKNKRNSDMEKELYTITPNDGDSGFTIHLANGEIQVPDEGGCYVVSTGCGSGKTESIKSLIRQKADRGIMYCVNSISELQKMHLWILRNLCGEGGLHDDDVVCISSDQMDRDDLIRYRHNPSLLTKKKIILLTHVRFWTDLINYFLVYNPDDDEPAFDGDFCKLMERQDLRQYVIFDETPTYIKPFVKLPKYILGLFGEKDSHGRWHCYDRDEIASRYDMFLKGTKSSFFLDDVEINRKKREVVLNLIPHYYNRWMLTDDEEFTITFRPVDLNQEHVNTHILIYEGAGDVLFAGSDSFQVLDIQHKYDAGMRFMPIPINKRRYEAYTDDEKQWVANSISDIVNSCDGKTLVVVWQTVGTNARDDEDRDISPFVDDIRRLMKVVPDKTFEITYFGSTKTKSTNEYRDFDNIILWGRWNIINADTAKFQDCYGTATSNMGHKAWYFIQLLCRIGIRRHNFQTGRDYNVFYTTDYEQKLIDALDVYFNKNTNILQPEVSPLEEKLIKKNVNKKVIPNIIELTKYDTNLGIAIRHSQDYAISFTVRDLFELIPIGKTPKSCNYQPLIKNLQKIGIALNIVQ